jgi:hypothetical protein
MLPRLINIEYFNSPELIESFRLTDTHIVCLATNGLSLFNVYGVEGDGLLTNEQGNEICRRSNNNRQVITCYAEFGLSLSVLPLLEIDFRTGEKFNFKNYHSKHKAYCDCFKELFRINKNLIDSPCVSFLFEPNEFDIDVGIEALFHICSSSAFSGGKSLEEVMYIIT